MNTARSKQVQEVSEISAITYGFMASKALFAALEFDVFTHIAGGANSLPDLGEGNRHRGEPACYAADRLEIAWPHSRARGHFTNAPATARYLVAGAAGDFRDYVSLVNGAFGYESFRHLGAALRGERVFPDKGFYEGLIYDAGIGGESFSSAQHTGSLGPARLMAKHVDLSNRRRLLDVGGGSGAYSLAFCAANSQLAATILDFPQTVDTARRYVQKAGLAGRIAHLAGNAITTDWPTGHDVVLMSYLWSAVGDDDIRVLAQRAMDALPPGGLVLVHDFMVDNDYEGPLLPLGTCSVVSLTIRKLFVSLRLTLRVFSARLGSTWIGQK